MKIKFIVFVIFLAALVLTMPGTEQLQQMVVKAAPTLVMVVDPGHGGPDGGAEGADGTREQEINLAIAKALKAEGEKYGIKVILTREDQEGLYADTNFDRKWRKLEDMKQRKAIIDAADADVVVSIHLNSFPADGNVRGAQVFYPKTGQVTEESRQLAERIQESLVEGMADGSNRIEMAKSDIYIFEDAVRPTVLVECGFLSNPADLENLQKKQYQQKVAVCILKGIQEYFSKEQRTKFLS